MTFAKTHAGFRKHFDNPPVRGLLIGPGMYLTDDGCVAVPQDVYEKLQYGFGFMREDVLLLRAEVKRQHESAKAEGRMHGGYERGDRYRHLADRIDLLVPMEEK